jgi:hypothetical protein
MGSIDDEIRAELEKEKAAKSQELNQGPATEPAIEQANKPTPVASPKSPAVTSLDSEILAEIKAKKRAPVASEPEEPQYITKFRQYGPDKDDEDIRTSIELLNPEERNNLLKSQPWVYNKMTPKQQEQEFQLSRKSHPFSAGELIGGIGSIIGTGVDLVKSAAELGMDIADVRISAPIRQAIENKSWFEVKGRNDQIQKAQDKLDQDARNLASSVPAGIINTTRTVQKIFGGKDLNGISNNIQRAIATAAPILGQQIGVPIGVTQNIVGTPMPLQAGEKPNPWSMVPQTGYIPFDLVTKLAEATYNKDVGGFAALDRLNEFLGLSDEEQSRNHDHIRRLYDAEVGAEDWKASVGEKKLSPWSQVAFSDIGQQAILLREKSMLPSAQFIADVDGTSIEEAEEKRERIAEANAEKATIELTKKWNKEYDPSMEFLGSLFIGDAGFGEAGLALGAGKLASPLIQKAKTLGMTDKEVSTYYAALQKLEKAKDIARQKKMSQPSWWGKSAGYVEQKQKDLSAAGQSLFERLPAPVQAAAPIAGKIATKVGLGGVGGGVGALLDPENPTAGLLEGITLTTALGTAPSIIRSIDTARRTIGAGEGKLFTQVAKSPESSLPARLIFNKATGPVIDYIAENGITLAKAGVNLGALSAITSTLNSDDPEDFNRAIAEGFGMGMGFHLAHGVAGRFHGKNPAQELKDRKKRDIEIHEAVKTASPATQGVLEQVTNYQTAIDRVDAFVARNERNLAEAIAKEDQKWIEMATTALKNSRALQREVLRANVQTRNEYGRSFLSTYADMNRLANGTRRAGQPNISIEILTPEQIVDLHVSENSRQGMTPDEIMAVRAQGESYAMERGFFDRAKNRAVINAGHVLARTTLFGESPSDALRHEASHALDEIPEFKKLNEKTDRLLFTNEEKDLQGNVLKRTEGIYDDKALVEMYLNKYIGERNAEEKIAFSEQLGLWNRDTQSLNVPEVVKYMKAEVRAELTAGNLRSGLGKLMGAEATIANWIGMRQKQNFLARAIQSVTGLGAKPFGSELLNIEYTPEVIAANREAIKALNEFNGRFEANPEGFSGREMSEKEIRTNPVLRKRYGLNGGEFQTELKGVIRDANGKIVGKPVTIANPFAAEGNWSFDAEGNRKQTRGYGQVPDEFQGAQIPAGGSLEVYRDFVYEPDGKTPVRTKPSDLAKLEKDRGDLIRQALTDAAYDDSTTRLTPFSADGLSWSGIMSKSQVQAIKDIPESILPLSIKEKILAFNDSMARGDGSTFDIDYAPRLGRGKAYKGRKSDIYHIIPIGFGFSKAGNFYLRTLSLNAAFRKLKARAKLMQGWLEPWDNDPNLFMKEFQETYLNNTYEKRDGWLGLDPENPTQKTPLAEVKFGRFLDFMNMIGAETPPNPQRAATPADPSARGRKKSKLGLEEDNQGIDNLWRSHRLDAIADIADTTEQTGRYRMDLDRVYKALMPAEPAPEAPMEERRPSAINLGISATYTPERKPFEARYVAPEGAALTASLVASGTSLESFGKESLAKLAEYYGITIPDGASRGEIIDSINEMEPSAKISFMPAEEKYPTSERGFYSGLQKTIDEKMPAKASPQQILSIVNNPQNAKADEVKWSNLAGFLEGKQSVTKQEVLDYLKNEGSVKFEEVSIGLSPEKQNQLKQLKEQKIAIATQLSGTQDQLLRWSRGMSPDDPRFEPLRKELSDIANKIDQIEKEKGLYGSYTLPNGENYREVVLTMPTGAENAELAYNDYNQSLREKYGVEDIGLVISEQEREIAQKLYEKINEGYRGEYTSSHFSDIPNYVAHMRLNERPDSEGRNGLFIEEIQSDRHQQGREKGYKSDPEVLKKAQSELNAAESALQSLQKLAATTPLDTPMGEKLPEKLAQAQVRYQEARQAVNSLSGQVPDAPFRKDWSVQMFKRALRDAIASDKEWIGWTKGETQVERFDISKQVDEIRHYPDMGYGEDKYIRIELDLANGQKHLLSVNKETGNTVSGVGPAEWSGKPLAEIIGKETADKILSGQGEDMVSEPQGVARLGGTTPKNYKSLSGEGLKIGGEGMKGFYDTILPKEIGKYVKKWGAKVEEGKIGQSISKEDMDMGDISDATPEELAQLEAQGMVSGPSVKIWKIDITPEMRESIQKGGQVAFMPKVAVVPERFTGTGAEETRRGKYVAPPKFFGQFNISQYEKGGKFFDAETGEDITDKSYENASISVDGGKPSLVANNESESMGTGPIIRSNLFKQKAGWKWISENPPETSTIVSVEGGGKHVYTLRADFQNGVKMARYPEKTSEPRLRPTGRGELVMGQEIGRIDIRGKKHPVYDTITIGEKPASDISFMPAGNVESEKFKEWFGKSEVVDKNGEPRVMYHGTDREFSEFQKGTTFFAFEPEFADEFANRSASGWQALSEEAYDPYKTKEEYESDLEKEPDQKQTPVIVPVYVRAENIFDANNAEHMKKIGLVEGMIQDFQQLEAYKPKMEKAGFDAYYDYEYGTEKDKTGIFTFSPKQVKSATGNTGEYSRKTSDISFMPAAKLDEAHASAIESGDMEEAQRLVDERAREARYTIGPVYHGTAATTEELTIPMGDRGVAAHVSFNKKVAKKFANSRAYDSGDDPQIHQWLIKGDIFDPTKSEHLQRLKNIIGENIDKGRPVDKIPTHADYSTFESTKLQDALKKAGFDGYYDREDNESGWDENIAIFDPNNIKSADPATYDDNGKLIPLSQRFDTSKPDIRFMPYSPELPKTEDGKVDWAGFKTRTQETAKPLAGLELPLRGQVNEQEIPVANTKADAEKESADIELISTGVEVPESVDEQSVISNAIKVANSQPWRKGRDFKLDMQRRVMDAAEKAGVTISERTAESIEYLARVGLKDALIALEQNPNAIGWYDEKTKQALGVMSLLFPEIATDENARFAFTWALAVTSNGLKVDKNFELAERVYREYRKVGKMPTNIEAGQAQKAINEGLGLFNKLTKEWGVDNTRKFMQTDFSVGEVSRLSKDLSPSGEFADTNVRGSSILGPKIGNGFFSNLYGLFDALTMDRWLVRTWGRWTGTLVELNPELTKQAMDRLQEAVQKLTPEDKKLIEGMIKKDISEVSLEDLSIAIQKASMKPELRDLMNKTETGEELRKSGNGLAKYLDGQKEAPSGPTERNFIREIFGLMLEELKSDPRYAELTMADLQAVLWYAEKRLYETAKVKSEQDNLDSSDADGYEDDEAPDYANAAIGVAREKGVSQKRIDEVLEKIKNERTTTTRPETQEGGGDQSIKQESAGGFTGKEKQKFKQYVAVTAARRNRNGNEKALWSYARGGGKDSGDAGLLKPKSKKNLGVKYISEWKAGRKLATMFRNNGLPPVKFLELDSTDKASAKKFADTLQQSKDASVNGAAVYVYPAEDYQGMKLFISESGQSGFALKPDGDIVSVFSMEKGSGRSIMETAIAAGGKKLDAFDTILPEFYGTHGFVEAARIPWNDEFAPEGWDKETFKKFNNGKPDVVMMVLDPKFEGEYEPRTDIYATDYDQAVEMQDSLLRKLNSGAKKKKQ